MTVVADATPLNYLVLIGLAKILPQLFGEVIIPSAVFNELQRSRTPEPVRHWIAARPAWLKIQLARESQIAGLEHLGDGEREAILLAGEVEADWLIMDDYDGRQEAGQRRLPVI